MAWGCCKVGERCAEREQATIAQAAPHRPLSCRATVHCQMPAPSDRQKLWLVCCLKPTKLPCAQCPRACVVGGPPERRKAVMFAGLSAELSKCWHRRIGRAASQGAPRSTAQRAGSASSTVYTHSSGGPSPGRYSGRMTRSYLAEATATSPPNCPCVTIGHAFQDDWAV